MSRKVKVRKVKKIPIIFTLLLFIIVFVILFLLYREVNIKNECKENTKLYIEKVNEYVKNSIYNYEGEYYVYKNTLFSNDNNDSFIISFNEDYPSLGSTLIIKENTVVNGVFYIGKYKITYKNSRITAKREKSAKGDKVFVEELVSKLEKDDSVSSINYKIIQKSINETSNKNLQSRLDVLSKKIVYSLGETIKYNPLENKTCDDGNNCYSFVVIGNNDDDKLTLIISETLKNSDSAWYSGSNDNSKGAVTATEKLNELTKDWKVDARLISYDEAIALGCSSKSKSCPEWLYQNIETSKGYWTSSKRNNNTSAWYVSNNGSIRAYSVNSDKFILRPVIDISKDILD